MYVEIDGWRTQFVFHIFIQNCYMHESDDLCFLAK